MRKQRRLVACSARVTRILSIKFVPLEAFIDSATLSKPKCVVLSLSFCVLDDCCCCCRLGAAVTNERFRKQFLQIHGSVVDKVARRSRLLARWTVADMVSKSCDEETAYSNASGTLKKMLMH